MDIYLYIKKHAVVMDFLLISPPYGLGIKKVIPEGMAIVNSFLRKRCDVEQVDLFMLIRRWNEKNDFSRYIDLNLFKDYDKIERYLDGRKKSRKMKKELWKILGLLDIRGQIIGFSIHSWSQMFFSLLLSKEIKNSYHNTIIFGGPYFRAVDREFIFTKFPWIDLLAVGDIELIYDDIIRLITKGKRGIVSSESASGFNLLPDYEQLDLNDYKYLFRGKYVKVLPIQTSQGCTYRCRFCNAWFANKLVLVNNDKIIKKINQLKDKYSVTHYFLINQYLNINAKKTKELCTSLKGMNIKWFSYARPDNLDDEMIELFADSGCIQLIFGLETASPYVQKLMDKRINISRFTSILKKLHNHNIGVIVNFIVGYPGETREDFKMTLDFIKKYGKYIDEIQINQISLLFNSLMYEEKDRKISSRISTLDRLTGVYPYHHTIKKSELHARQKTALKFAYRSVIRKKYIFLRFVPFFIFNYLYNNNNLFGNTFLYKLFLLVCRLMPLNRYLKK